MDVGVGEEAIRQLRFGRLDKRIVSGRFRNEGEVMESTKGGMLISKETVELIKLFNYEVGGLLKYTDVHDCMSKTYLEHFLDMRRELILIFEPNTIEAAMIKEDRQKK
jgi:hypothetical protein